jgi:glycosyltransferase involved in cell wall biosynthesis
VKNVMVVIPALNEEGLIASVVRGLRDRGFERIRVIDNGSSDDTAARARSAGAAVCNEPRRGYGSACQRGISRLPSGIDWVLFCDADGSDDLSGLPTLFAIAPAADLVIGSRRMTPQSRKALTGAQDWGNELAVALIRWGWGVRYTDLGPLRLVRRSALEAMQIRDRGSGWTVEMQIRAAELGLRVVEAPVRYFPRQAGRSKISGTVRGTLRAGSAILWKIAVHYTRHLLCRNCKTGLDTITHKV